PLYVAREADDHSCRCSCDHERCATERARCWCRYWLYVHWWTAAFVSTELLVSTMRQCVGDRDGRLSVWGAYSGAPDRECEYRVLVMADPAGPGFSDDQINRLKNPEESCTEYFLVPEASQLIKFCCCKVRLGEAMTPDWTIRGERDVFWPGVSFGDEDLQQELQRWLDCSGIGKSRL
ncbi:MAG: hypothetical protein ACRERD_31285, partial [Candidatus Binatia bacterium]